MGETASCGILFVISAPSGTGKSTLARRLVAAVPDLAFSVSYTTRPRREGERDGVDYHFVERPRFRALVETGAMIEWAEVFGELYGTGLEATRRALDHGDDLVLDIDVEGARQVRAGPIASVTVMLLPPDFRTLEARLRGRGREEPAELNRRLARAREEVERFAEFDYVIVNDRLEETALDLAAIVRAERCRSARASARARRVVASFPA